MTADDPTLSRLLHHKAYVRFLYVRVAASIALQIQVVAVGWQMYALTGSPFRLGLIGLVQFVPVVSFFLLTGHVADRYDRRIVTFIGEVVEALAVAVLAIASATDRLTPDLLLAMAFVVGTGRARTYLDVVHAVCDAAGKPRSVAFIDTPEELKGQYQSFTQAPMDRLRAAESSCWSQACSKAMSRRPASYRSGCANAEGDAENRVKHRSNKRRMGRSPQCVEGMVPEGRKEG